MSPSNARANEIERAPAMYDISIQVICNMNAERHVTKIYEH